MASNNKGRNFFRKLRRGLGLESAADSTPTVASGTTKATFTRADLVAAAYRTLLQREPEDNSAVEKLAATFATPEEILNAFLKSPEHKRRIDEQIIERRFCLDDAPQLPIEVYTSAEKLQALLDRIQQSWTSMGKSDPYFSVLTADRYKTATFEQNKLEFFRSGMGDVARFNRWLERNRIHRRSEWRCLEYGCGTGRITLHLAKQFQKVFGYDISQPHLDLAQTQLATAGEINGTVEFRQIATIDDLRTMPEVDVIFSIIVLQHNPPPVIGFILDNLLSRLKPGGVAYFQVPTAWLNYTFKTAEYLDATDTGSMETHVLPQQVVFEIARNNACDIIEVQPDNCIGALEVISNTFLLRKATKTGQISD